MRPLDPMSPVVLPEMVEGCDGKCGCGCGCVNGVKVTDAGEDRDGTWKGVKDQGSDLIDG